MARNSVQTEEMKESTGSQNEKTAHSRTQGGVFSSLSIPCNRSSLVAWGSEVDRFQFQLVIMTSAVSTVFRVQGFPETDTVAGPHGVEDVFPLP